MFVERGVAGSQQRLQASAFYNFTPASCGSAATRMHGEEEQEVFCRSLQISAVWFGMVKWILKVDLL